MKLAIAGDSAGEPLARALYEYLKTRDGLEVTELSKPIDGSKPVNGANEFYANLSDRVCSGVTQGTYDRAILVCGTGIGVCIAANKVPGIRAALTHDTYSAGKAATSNNAHVITMGARVVGVELAKTIADAWLTKEFDVNGSSAKNVEAINQVDEKYHRS